MSTSFADAVRGGGQSLAGKPSEEDDAWTGKAHPLDAVLRCPKTIGHVLVLHALMSRCGPGAISCVRSTSATNYLITCRADADLLVLIADPTLVVDGASCSVFRAGEPLRSVTLRNVPYDATEEDLRLMLKPFATLLAWSHETYKDFPGIANGNRRLHIKMPLPLPNFLSFRKKRVIVSYQGVQLLCFKCGSPEHTKKECPMLTPVQTAEVLEPSKIVTSTGPELEASKAMPPPETPTKTQKRKKSNASPAPSQSPSPRSRKRQPSKSPVAVSPLPSPSARLQRSASTSSLSRAGSPSCKKPSPLKDHTEAEDATLMAFHERAFKIYLKADDDGMDFRPGVEVLWIKHWCPSCFQSDNIFSVEACSSSPGCEGKDVTGLGLPKNAGVHLMLLSAQDEWDFVVFDVGPKRWNVSPFYYKDLTHHQGPCVPEYASGSSL